jgi:hypothetical protein
MLGSASYHHSWLAVGIKKRLPLGKHSFGPLSTRNACTLFTGTKSSKRIPYFVHVIFQVWRVFHVL